MSSTGDGYCQFHSIDRMGPTKYQTADTGNRSLVAPARPACAKFIIAESIFYNVKELLYCDYVIHQTAWLKVKKSRVLKRKEIQNSSSFNATHTSLQSPLSNYFLQFLDTTSGEMRAGRVPDTPYNENYIGTSLKTVTLIKAIHHHAKNCIGNIVIRRSNVVQKRLSIQITVSCSEKNKCSTWERGSYPWQSTNKVCFPDSSRPAFVPDVLYAMACYMTPSTKAHAEQFFSCMLLVPPSRPMLNDLVKSFVSPYLLQKKEQIINMRCGELRGLGDGIIINMDVGYTGARKAQCATVMVGSGSRAIFSRIDTENGAWLKEGILVSLALDEAINVRKLDVVAVEIDDNAANKKKIENYKRVNGPTEYREESVKGLNDVFHAAKSMGRQAVKIVATYVQQLESQIKPLIESHSNNWEIEETLLYTISNNLEMNFISYFSDISDKFENLGATEWVEANRLPENMLKLANELNLTDTTINYDYWVPIVNTWNQFKPPSASNADNISGIRISKGTSARCQTALVRAVNELINEVELNETSVSDKISYLRSRLPAICFSGDNYSVNFTECVEKSISELKNENSSDNKKTNEKQNELIKEVFNSKIPSVSDIKKMKSEKLIKLAEHLKCDLPSPMQKQDVKIAREYCVKNIWRLQGHWEDINAAISLAHRAFSARIGEYKKLLKSLIRIVNETYGLWSIRFKTNFVLNGLLNFCKHFCNKHNMCSSYIWWTQCSNSHLNEYLPSQEYVHNISSGRGSRCNTYIPLFFEIFVKSFTLSPYMESLLSKCILYSKTTICESYFHWLGIMVPKWQNVTKNEYILREAAAYVAFCERQDDKLLFTKKLRQHKYASTLVGTAGQKNSRYERHIFEAVLSVLSTDPASVNSANCILEKIQKRQQNREARLNVITENFSSDVTAQNLRMGPVKHEYRTAGVDGVLSGKQNQESTNSAKPVPPFPFRNEELLKSDNDKQRLIDIWDWTKSLNSKKKLAVQVDNSCGICQGILDNFDEIGRCHNCKTPAHEACLGTHSTGRTKNEENLYCGQCVIISSVDLSYSI